MRPILGRALATFRVLCLDRVLYDFPFPLELPSVYLWFYRYVAKRKRPFSTFPLNVDPGKQRGVQGGRGNHTTHGPSTGTLKVANARPKMGRIKHLVRCALSLQEYQRFVSVGLNF